ncbi:hypothetical protein [Tateyamaria sp. ANG-S1]|uniref:hypothetical protein n=1 Tax=Tateyamaria sp. ANG-S1 TaxID=1577905 RepID=UPI00057D749C|nr:hypothetical protein [Tateyamaria sp. ANG-S1]KIC49703.1 hypothetical protein RA29_08575 [Tateyamaria sp. ANG-S1]
MDLGRQIATVVLLASFIFGLWAIPTDAQVERNTGDLTTTGIDKLDCDEALQLEPIVSFTEEGAVGIALQERRELLVGKECRQEHFTKYFLERGWVYIGLQDARPGGKNSPTANADNQMTFCFYGSFLRRVTNRCKLEARIYRNKRQVVHIVASTIK